MTRIVAMLAVVESREGLLVVFYEAQVIILEWESVDEGDKRLRVINLFRQWKADIICLQESN
jgi:hypothetical protein